MNGDPELEKARRCLESLRDAATAFEEWASYYGSRKAARERLATLIIETIGIGGLEMLNRTMRLITPPIEEEDRRISDRSPIKGSKERVDQDALYSVVTNALSVLRTVQEKRVGVESWMIGNFVDLKYQDEIERLPPFSELPGSSKKQSIWAELIAETIVAGARYYCPSKEMQELSARVEKRARSFTKKKRDQNLARFLKEVGIAAAEFNAFSDREKSEYWDKNRGDRPYTEVETVARRAKHATETSPLSRDDLKTAWRAVIVDKLDSMMKPSSGS